MNKISLIKGIKLLEIHKNPKALIHLKVTNLVQEVINKRISFHIV
jgi:uncharacterized protein YejL (UPF0352 family)